MRYIYIISYSFSFYVRANYVLMLSVQASFRLRNSLPRENILIACVSGNMKTWGKLNFTCKEMSTLSQKNDDFL